MNRAVLILGAAVGVALAVSYARRRATNPAAGFFDSINPASRDNVVYTSVNAAGAALTGNAEFNLGVAAYEVAHPFEDPAAGRTGPTWLSLSPLGAVYEYNAWLLGKMRGATSAGLDAQGGNVDPVTIYGNSAHGVAA